MDVLKQQFISMKNKIYEQNQRMVKMNNLIDELVQENKAYKDAIDRQNKYIESNRTAIERFDESNRGD